MFGSSVNPVRWMAACAVAGALAGCGDSGTGTGDSALTSGAVCGNGIIEGMEKCDFNTMNHVIPMGASCAAESGGVSPNGQLGCMAGCMSFDLAGCGADAPPVSGNTCGDGNIDPGETCEHAMDGTARFQVGMDSCAAVTSGANPVGALGCDTACQITVAQCTAGDGQGGVGGNGGGGMGGGGTGGGAVVPTGGTGGP